jgi:hypothetical protein
MREDSPLSGTTPCPNGLRKRGAALADGGVPSGRSPFGSLGRWREEPGAERRIFLILPILHILSKAVPVVRGFT